MAKKFKWKCACGKSGGTSENPPNDNSKCSYYSDGKHFFDATEV